MTRTILLADDSVTIQKVVELTFLDEDFRVVSFGNGSDAIGRLAEIRPDVILADVHMPGADGYEVCAAAQRELPGCPVLLLVGTFEVFDGEQAGASGARGHLKKPFDSQELLRRVKELLEGAPAPVAAEGASWSMPLEAAEDGNGAEPAHTAAFDPSVSGESGGDQEDWSFEPIGEEGFELGAAQQEAEPAPIEEDLAVTEPPPVVEALPRAIEPAVDFQIPQVESMAEAGVAAAAAAAESAVGSGAARIATGPLSDDDVDRIARRLVELLGERVVRDVAWDVVPDLAEVLVKERIRELEASVE